MLIHPVTLVTRYGTFAAIIIAALVTGILVAKGWHVRWLFYPLLFLAAVGIWNLFQNRHTLLRNYPVIAYVRWISEELRPFLHQYIVESNLEGRPYTREHRSLIYQRAKADVDVHPFGTELDVYGDEYEWIAHSIAARHVDPKTFRVEVGGAQCSKPYSASLLNISAMSFGALGAHAIEALNLGAKLGGFYHDTGEGSISPYHRKNGGDLVWELGSGYFGCRDRAGRFDPKRFADQATSEQVKMIEIKLSQGAKPGHGGVLPAEKVTAEIAQTRGVPMGEDCVSPPAHSAFSTPIEMMEFIARLRDLSGGKPVGFKLCIGNPYELMAICKAMIETEILADFIVIDGAEGGTGAAPVEFSDHIGMPLREGLVFAQNALVGAGLRDKLRLASSGKVSSAYYLAANMAIGADWCNAARAFMFSLGCVMSMRCHTGECPTGVTTHDPLRQRGLVVPEKAKRVQNYQRETLNALAEVVGAAGLEHPRDLRPAHIFRRTSPVEAFQLDDIYDFIAPGELLESRKQTRLVKSWRRAQANSFAPVSL
ncbi:FMN-binding glutamate synthase family protein [Microbaculum marinum]|uniref:FMN-binding glutamate synthase family protein n=1 Tax=Microbaculum marinum TaxID=1764581 RepID=A0AAW9RWZ2_9HYPH